MKIALFHNRKNREIAYAIGTIITREACTVIFYETETIWETELCKTPITVLDAATHVLFIYDQNVHDFSLFLFLSGLALGRGIPIIVIESDPSNSVPKKCRNFGNNLKPGTFESFFITEKNRFRAEDKKNKARADLLARGISCFDENFMTIVSSGDSDIVSLFLEAGFSPSLVDSKGIPLLSLAVRSQFPRVVSQLIEAGADVNRLSGDRSYSPLMDASQKGDIAMVKLLLEKGAQCDLKSKDGQTALIICAGRGDAEMAELLVSHGADPTVKDLLGMSASGYAKLFKNQKLMELFNIPPA